METESSLQNVFWKINRMLFLDKDRMIDNVQKYNICTMSYGHKHLELIACCLLVTTLSMLWLGSASCLYIRQPTYNMLLPLFEYYSFHFSDLWHGFWKYSTLVICYLEKLRQEESRIIIIKIMQSGPILTLIQCITDYLLIQMSQSDLSICKCSIMQHNTMVWVDSVFMSSCNWLHPPATYQRMLWMSQNRKIQKEM
jgi:hypothetical protein